MSLVARFDPEAFSARDTIRSAWLTEALAREPRSAGGPVVEGQLSADVCVVGGGFTGLWTALSISSSTHRSTSRWSRLTSVAAVPAVATAAS